MEDKIIFCIECKSPFKFTSGEQDWYAEKKFVIPKRCPACRAKRKKQRQEQQTESSEHYMSRQTKAPWDRKY